MVLDSGKILVLLIFFFFFFFLGGGGGFCGMLFGKCVANFWDIGAILVQM